MEAELLLNPWLCNSVWVQATWGSHRSPGLGVRGGESVSWASWRRLWLWFLPGSNSTSQICVPLVLPGLGWAHRSRPTHSKTFCTASGVTFYTQRFDLITTWLKTLQSLLLAFGIKFKFQVVEAPPQTRVWGCSASWLNAQTLESDCLHSDMASVTFSLCDLTLWASVSLSAKWG